MTEPAAEFAVSFADALQRAVAGESPAEEWLVPLLACAEADYPALAAAADRLRRETVGDAVHLRALIEFSNHCRRNCRYCGLRRDNRKATRYRLAPERIVEIARLAASLGYRTLVMQSGEDLWFDAERLASIIRAIKAETDMAITLSVGERDRETYRLWREAGADRCLLRIETTDPDLFAALHPDDDFGERAACLVALRDLGYQLGTGVMVGLPGQTPAMLARDVIWMHKLGAEMIGVGPFIPHPETPLAAAAGGTVAQTLRLVAVLRLVFPWAHLPATTAVGTLDPLGRERALAAGANVVMPNVTPAEFRPQYEIYPNKICTGEEAAECRNCLALRLRSIGRDIATDHGHVRRVAEAGSR